jgi:acyl carrier protein
MLTQEEFLRLLRTEHDFDLQMEDRFDEIPNFDSLSIVEVIMTLETEYDIDIEDDLIDGLETVKELFDLVNDLS